MQGYKQRYGAMLALFLGLLFSHNAHAEPGDEELLSGGTYMRAVSLDLRGKLPTLEEYQQVDANGEIPESLLDEWLGSEDFVERVVNYHKKRFWNRNPETNFTAALLYQVDSIHYSPAKSYIYGRAGVCGDFPAEFDEDGRPIQFPQGGGYVDEGWVEVAPYWDPDNPIKICAMDAQENLTSSLGVACNTDQGSYAAADCGCGPNLAWCVDNGYMSIHLTSAMDEDVDRRVAEMIRQERSYIDLLTDNRAWVNGPMTHWLRYTKQRVGYSTDISHLPYDEDILPDLHWTDDDIWVELELGSEQSGVLTAPSFLLRFMSNRSRADRFFNEFLCQPFQAPEGGIPTGDDAVPTLNLSVRDGCKYCHAILEPAAASWGRFVQGGAGYLDPDTYPDYNPDCTSQQDGGSRDCNYHYVIPRNQEEYPYDGWLRAFSFLEERHHHMVELGPKVLVEQGSSDGRLSRCIAKKAAEHHLNRELESREEEWLLELAADFEASGWQYKDLVKAIVKSSSYRRLP